MKRTRNPYGNTAKRKKALAWMATNGITQPRGRVGYIKVDTLVNVTLGPVSKSNVLNLRKAHL